MQELLWHLERFILSRASLFFLFFLDNASFLQPSLFLVHTRFFFFFLEILHLVFCLTQSKVTKKSMAFSLKHQLRRGFYLFIYF